MCIKAVMASVEGTFADGVAKEQQYGAVLFTSGQAQALQHAFFAQRAATKVRCGILKGFKFKESAKASLHCS